MANDIYRRCGCRDEDGKQLAAACTALADPKHGSWGYYISAGTDPKTGKRLQYRKSGFPTKRAAQQARNEVASKVDKGTYVAPSKESYADYLAAWLPRRINTGEGLRPATAENYARYITNDIAPSALGRMPLTEIRTFHINDFLHALTEAGRGAVTVRRIAAVVQGSLRAASRARKVENNPATDLELPTVNAKEVNIWEPAQVGHFLDVAAEHRLGALFEVDMFTGLRRAEIIALRWEAVDLAQRRMEIRVSKTKAGRRFVDIDDRTVGALIAWKILQSEEAGQWGDMWEDSGFVFTMDDGRPLKPQYVTRLFDKLRITAELPKLTFHGSRHEHASLMIASGADIAVISKRLGHSSISITSDIYGHLIGSASRNAAEGASALVPSKRVQSHTLHTQASDEGMKKAPART